MTDNYYIIELTEDFITNANDRGYYKDERLIVWFQADGKCCRVCNNNADFIPIDYTRKLHKIEFKNI